MSSNTARVKFGMRSTSVYKSYLIHICNSIILSGWCGHPPVLHACDGLPGSGRQCSVTTCHGTGKHLSEA